MVLEGSIQISDKPVSLEQFSAMLDFNGSVELSASVRKAIETNRSFLEGKLKDGNESFYGINTGFGSLYKVRINRDQIETLQENLVRSHATGAGPEVEEHIVRKMLLLKIISLSRACSGVTLSLVEQLLSLYNEGINPRIFSFGSLGASGDLAPLAHLSLPLIGAGEVNFQGKVQPAGEALKSSNIQPIRLRAKEGLALINGTQFSNAFALHAVLEGYSLLKAATFCAAASLDAFDGNLSPFHPRIQELRNSPGQEWVAGRVRSLLSESEIAGREGKQLQDPYAYRCVPQVHGATYQAWHHAREVVEREINAVTDNPLVLGDQDAIISGGNFHAQPLAIVMDYLCIALAELGNISERRCYQLLSGQRGLPDYLVSEPGLQSGLMIIQYTAASIVNRNKILCSPASTDSIVSSMGQEDHVSMAANAGTKLYEVIENLWLILGIEWITASTALEYRKPLKSGISIEALKSEFSKRVPPVAEDRILSGDIEKAARFVREYFGKNDV